MRIPLEIDKAVQLEDGNVVVEVAGRVLGMELDGEDVELNVGVELGVVVDVPLAHPDAQLLRPAQ